MATATVLYVLNLGGDMARELPSLSAGLGKLRDQAVAAKAAAVGLGTEGRSALNGLADEGGKAAEGAFKAAAGFVAVGFAVHTLLKDQEDYQQSTARLVSETAKLTSSLAEAASPAVSGFIDAFTIGLVYIGNLIGNTVGPAITTLVTMVKGLGDAFLASIDAWKAIARGDFSGAKEAIKANHAALFKLVDDAKAGWAAIGEGRDAAFTAAFEAWKRQNDDISDLALDTAAKVKQAYADVVTGVSVGAGSVSLGSPTAAIPMGQQTGPSAGISGDSGIPTALEEEGDKVMDKIGGLQSSIMGGMTGMIGMITGIRESIRGMLEFLKTFGDMSMDDAQLVIDTILGLSDQLGKTISDVPMKIIDAMPDMITAILALIPQLVLDLIASGPKILVSVIKAIIALPATIAKAFGDMFREFWEDIKEAFKELGSIFTGKEGKFLGTSLAGKGNEGNRSVFGIHVEKFHSGGTVTRSGLAELQAGEVVSTPSQMRQRGGGSQRANVTINVNGAQDTERIVREIRAKLGSYGVGLTLEPYGGR